MRSLKRLLTSKRRLAFVVAASGVLFGCAAEQAIGDDPELLADIQGGKAVPGPGVIFQTEPVRPGSDECPAGGIAILAGVDANGNGRLEEDEVDTDLTEFICNGQMGAIAFAA